MWPDRVLYSWLESAAASFITTVYRGYKFFLLAARAALPYDGSRYQSQDSES